MSDEAYDQVVSILEAKGLNPTPTARGVKALCPVHDDHSPSLAVDRGAGCALITCRTGCDTADVLDALGLKPGELFDEPLSKPWTTDGLRRTGARLESDGRWRMGGGRYRPGATPKMLHDEGAARDLWPDPSTVEGRTLYVVEGEPDALTGNSLGLPTVGVPGAAKDWPEEWLRRLAEGRDRIVVISDADGPGRKMAARQAQRLVPLVPEVRVLDLFPGVNDSSDLSDFAARNPLSAVEEVKKAARDRGLVLSGPRSAAPPALRQVDMPNDTSLEREVLRKALKASDGRTVVGSLVSEFSVTPDLFFDPVNRGVWIALSRTDGATDPGTIGRAVSSSPDWLERGTKAVDIAAAAVEIAALPDQGETREMVEHLRDLAQRRATIRAAMEIIEEAQDPKASADQVIARAEKKVQAANLGLPTRREAVSFREMGNLVIRNALEERASVQAGGTGRALFGLEAVDKMTKGLKPEQMMLVAGEPGSGKTSLVTDLALRFARSQAKAPDNVRVHTTMISAEMPQLELGQKITQMLSGVGLHSMDPSQVSNRDLEVVRASWKNEMTFRDLPFNAIFPGRLTSSELLLLIAKQVRDNNTGLVIIDHFRRFRMDDPPRNANDHDEEKALFLEEEICKGLGVAVICICHTRKKNENFGPGRPGLSDLRGSGQITASADYVAFTHRPGAERRLKGENVSDEDFRKTELVWAKGRYHGTGITELDFDPTTMTFMDRTQVAYTTAWQGPDLTDRPPASGVPLPNMD